MIDEDGRLESIYDALVHVSSIFPSDTNLTCTLTAQFTLGIIRTRRENGTF